MMTWMVTLIARRWLLVARSGPAIPIPSSRKLRLLTSRCHTPSQQIARKSCKSQSCLTAREMAGFAGARWSMERYRWKVKKPSMSCFSATATRDKSKPTNIIGQFGEAKLALHDRSCRSCNRDRRLGFGRDHLPDFVRLRSQAARAILLEPEVPGVKRNLFGRRVELRRDLCFGPPQFWQVEQEDQLRLPRHHRAELRAADDRHQRDHAHHHGTDRFGLVGVEQKQR